jgi:ubiquinone/menaquinone biosynthesis C-methylase UbiE
VIKVRPNPFALDRAFAARGKARSCSTKPEQSRAMPLWRWNSWEIRSRKGIGKLDSIERMLRGIDGGKVLDVATHEGHFVRILMENLKSYKEIVGIDVNEESIETAIKNLAQENVRFLVMDAERLDFEDESIDTVNISASLHHLANIPRVLDEMDRVLTPGGHFIIVEMHRDGQTEAALTSIYLHQWVAEVDTALGYLHNSTLARQELVNYMARLDLSNVEYDDYIDIASDPMEKARIEQLERLIERTIQRAEGTNNYGKFEARGNELLYRLHKTGAQREPIIIVVGKK